MDRDTFWENVVDILKIVGKVIFAMVALQLLLMVTGSDIKIPYVYSKIMKFVFWLQKTFGSARFGM